MKHKILSLLLTISLVFTISSCTQTETVETETTAVTEILSMPQDSFEIKASQIPDGWSLDQIYSLLKIDDNSLKLHATTDDLQDISRKIKVSDQPLMSEILYDKTSIGYIVTEPETSEISEVCLSFYSADEILDEITFAGYNFSEAEKITEFLHSNFETSKENNNFLGYKWQENGINLELEVTINGSAISEFKLKTSPILPYVETKSEPIETLFKDIICIKDTKISLPCRYSELADLLSENGIIADIINPYNANNFMAELYFDKKYFATLNGSCTDFADKNTYIFDGIIATELAKDYVYVNSENLVHIGDKFSEINLDFATDKNSPENWKVYFAEDDNYSYEIRFVKSSETDEIKSISVLTSKIKEEK